MGELSRRLWRRVSFGIKKPQRRTSGHKSASHCGESREEISMNNPTILRTRHKFGDYLSQPDIAKFELPKKMSRPWIVNNAYEEEKLKTLIVTETPVEASEVMLQIKEVKAERRKHVGYNKKQVRNINEIIEKDLYQNDLGYTRGNIGKGGIGGAVRAAQVDERTKVRISQTLKKNMQKQQAVWGGATSIKGSDAKTRRIVSGMASSVAFTPVQGLEIMNPAAAEAKVNAANQKYFSATSGFLSVKPKTT